MNKHAQALGRLNRGKTKQFTASELEKRRARLIIARKARWPVKANGQ